MSGFGFSGEELKGRFEADPCEDEDGWDDAQPPQFWQSSSGDPRYTGRNSGLGGPASEPRGRWPGDVRITELPEGMRPGERSLRGHGRMTAAQAARAYLKSMAIGKKPATARRRAEDGSETAQADETSS